MILNKLGKCPNKIFARKTAPVIGGANKEFFEENHLMGKGKGEIFSLLYDGEPVAAIQICRLKDNDYDISRFCCKKNHSVIGGFSKLLKLVEQTLKMDSLKTFIDLRYGKGGYLEDLGFKRGNPSLSFHWTNGERRFHRLKFRGATGYDKGLARIWDCGQLPFTKEY